MDKLKDYFYAPKENNNLYSNVTVGKLNPKIYENMNGDELTNTMLSAAYVKEYATVAYIIKNFHDKLDFTKQVKGDGSTILHYFARDYAMIQGTDPIPITDNAAAFVKQAVSKLPLFVAITLGHPKRDKFINLQDKDGNTAIFIAQKSNNHAFIDVLLSYGASLEICNNLGLQVQCVTETESDRLGATKHCKSVETKCHQQINDTYKSDDFTSINIEQTRGIKSYDPYKLFFESTKKNSNTETSEFPTQTIESVMVASVVPATAPSPTGTTEEDLRSISKKYREKYGTSGDQFKNLDSFLSDKTNNIPMNNTVNQVDDIPTSDLLGNLTKPQNQYYQAPTQSASESKTKSVTGSQQNTENFINELITQLRSQYPPSTQAPVPTASTQPAPQQFAMTGGKKETPKIKGTRNMFEYKTNNKKKFADYDFYGGRSSTNSSEKAMHSMQRVMEQTIRDTEIEIIATIKKIMKITDDELARDYRSGVWYLFKAAKGDALNELSRLDRTLEFQKFINEANLKKVDLKDAKKRRQENKQRQEERKTSSQSSQSSSSITSSSPSSPAPVKQKASKDKKETKTKVAKTKEGSRKSIHVSEYSLGSDLSSLKFSDSSYYHFSNKGVMPSNTSTSFNSYTSSNRF